MTRENYYTYFYFNIILFFCTYFLQRISEVAEVCYKISAPRAQRSEYSGMQLWCVDLSF